MRRLLFFEPGGRPRFFGAAALAATSHAGGRPRRLPLTPNRRGISIAPTNDEGGHPIRMAWGHQSEFGQSRNGPGSKCNWAPIL